jgi:threonine synthase
VRAAAQTDGTYITVKDEEIIKAIAELGTMGIFAEPAGAAAYAGLVKGASTGVVGSEDPVLVMNTGSGLKDVRAALQAVQSAPVIEPTLEAVQKIL